MEMTFLYSRILEKCWAIATVPDCATSTSGQYIRTQSDAEKLKHSQLRQNQEAIDSTIQLYYLERRLFL